MSLFGLEGRSKQKLFSRILCNYFFRITVGALIKNVGEKYGIPEHEFDNLKFLDNFIEEAIEKDENRNYEAI